MYIHVRMYMYVYVHMHTYIIMNNLRVNCRHPVPVLLSTSHIITIEFSNLEI